MASDVGLIFRFRLLRLKIEILILWQFIKTATILWTICTFKLGAWWRRHLWGYVLRFSVLL